jgi:hypothetical protein
MMARHRPNEKTGKSARQSGGAPFRFSRLSKSPLSDYALLASMPEPRHQTTITAIWETLPDADPKAVEKAFALLFRRGPGRKDSAKTGGDLPELDKTH